MNDTVCLTQSTTASFTCVVEDQENIGITNAEWHILDGEHYQHIGGRPRHTSSPNKNGDIITDTLTITNVSVDDNGAQYRCQPEFGRMSENVTLTVLGEIIIKLWDIQMYSLYTHL